MKERQIRDKGCIFVYIPSMSDLQENHERRERVFLILAAVFLGSMTLLNVIGITRFIQWGPLSLAVGVLPYPLTFLCTDLISELYGKRRASFLVWVGLGLNIFVIFVLYLGQLFDPVEDIAKPPWQVLSLAKPVGLPNGETVEGEVSLFSIIYACTAGSVFASMVAYMAAQFCDVYIYHFLKRLTKGKALWLRNNLSTLSSQMVDSVTITSVVFGASFYRGEVGLKAILIIMLSNYAFKVVAALVDTLPFYLGIHYLGPYLGMTQEEIRSK